MREMTRLGGGRRVPGRNGRRAGFHRLVAGAMAGGLLVAACATNPATGRRQLNFYSEAQEIELGSQADREITAQLGLVDDPELQAYVADLGKRLAAKSERPHLPWTFRVVDDPVVNAFALPGGFIYVTRGILAHMRSEAELASVLGHEIGHVTAQHGVNQMSKQQLAVGGLMVGMVLAPEAGQLGQLAQAGLGLLFLKYGRDDERQADDLGLRYLVETGYETREMASMFRVLEGVGEIAGASRLPNWLSTHPEPAQRRERTSRLIAERGYAPGEVGGERFLRRTDGLVFGPDPREGYFQDGVFYHPELAFRAEFPRGWRRANEKSRVVALHADQIAQVELALSPARSAGEAAEAFVRQEGLTADRPRRTQVNGLPAETASFEVARQQGSSITGAATFVELGGRVFRLLAVATADRAASVRRELVAFLDGFAPLTDRRHLDVRPQRIALVELPRAMSFDEFLRAYPSEADPRVVALLNGVDDPASSIGRGSLLKRVQGARVGD